MRETRTCSLSGGRRPAPASVGAPPPTRLKVKGKWSYLYRAIDREGNLVDSMLSATRDMAAAQRFFRGALSMSVKLRSKSRPTGTIPIHVPSAKC